MCGLYTPQTLNSAVTLIYLLLFTLDSPRKGKVKSFVLEYPSMPPHLITPLPSLVSCSDVF